MGTEIFLQNFSASVDRELLSKVNNCIVSVHISKNIFRRLQQIVIFKKEK